MSIRKSIFLVLMMIVIHLTVKTLFSFIPSVTLIALLSNLVMLGILLYFLKHLVQHDPVDTAPITLKEVNGGILLIATLGVFCLALLPLPRLSFFSEEALLNITLDYIKNKTDLPFFIYMCLIAPVFEELLFRGVLLGGLLKRYSPIIAIGTSSILFAVLHPGLTGPFVFGLFVGWVYYRTRNLWYGMIMHSFGNLLGFALRYAIYSKFTTIEVANNFLEMHQFLIGTVLTLVLLSTIYILHKMLPKSAPAPAAVYTGEYQSSN